MVSRKTNKCKTVIIVGTILVIFAVVMVVLCALKSLLVDTASEGISAEDNAQQNSGNIEAEQDFVPGLVLPMRVDFQTLVDDWAASVGGNRSVLIYDLERDEMVGSYNVDEDYSTASLYKLFVVYEGYRRVQSGEWGGDDVAGGTGRTILECLDLAIRESYSPCAETLWGYIGHEALDEIVASDFGITNSDISHLVSNPRDIMKMMQIFYEHTEITDEKLIAQMRDSFLNQPATTYNWRQGLPSGFSRANIYNKVGWDYNPDGGHWNIYHDVAIVEFSEYNRHYIVVVMTNYVPFQEIRELGEDIEKAFYEAME